MDIVCQAKSGMGKTAVFVLATLQQLEPVDGQVSVLVMCHTRELAFQISKEYERFSKYMSGVKVSGFFGGMPIQKDEETLKTVTPHIVVGTPGRILYHLEHTKGFSLRSIKFLVMDEADKLLDMDFEEEITKILHLLPKERRTFLFSATMTRKVDKLQRASLMNPVRVEICAKYTTVDTLVQNYLFIPAKYKDCYLAYLLNEYAGNSVIVFVATRKDTQRVAIMLRNLGFGALPLHGQLTQTKRLGSLNKFIAGDRNVLIATDVASRGLDIEEVDLVINFDLPTHSKSYIHRVGRTARGNRSGRAITLVTQYDVELFQRIEQLIGKKLDKLPVEESEVLVMLERVTEAQRIAAIELRESGFGGKKPTHDDEEEQHNNTVKKRKVSGKDKSKLRKKTKKINTKI